MEIVLPFPLRPCETAVYSQAVHRVSGRRKADKGTLPAAATPRWPAPQAAHPGRGPSLRSHRYRHPAPAVGAEAALYRVAGAGHRGVPDSQPPGRPPGPEARLPAHGWRLSGTARWVGPGCSARAAGTRLAWHARSRRLGVAGSRSLLRRWPLRQQWHHSCRPRAAVVATAARLPRPYPRYVAWGCPPVAEGPGGRGRPPGAGTTGRRHHDHGPGVRGRSPPCWRCAHASGMPTAAWCCSPAAAAPTAVVLR